jgi:hypothetical protein
LPAKRLMHPRGYSRPRQWLHQGAHGWQSTEVQWPTIVLVARQSRRHGQDRAEDAACAGGLRPRGLRIQAPAVEASLADGMSDMIGTDRAV